MTPQERFTLIQEAMQAFNPHYRETIQQVFTETAIQGQDWYLAYLAYGLEPEPFTAVTFHHLFPYVNPKTQQERLAQTAANGYLETVDTDTYRLTDVGREPVEAFFAAAGGAIAPLAPLPKAKMARLADLLARIIAATETAEPPITKTHMYISRRTDPGSKATPANKIDQYLTDLIGYRDDAHLAAWAGLGVNGRTWETFTAVWREQANTTAALAATFANRSYSAADYAAALDELTELGWIAADAGEYRVTDNGRKLREEAEATTDRYYFTGWSALDAAETAELDQLLIQLRDRLQAMAADKATAIHSKTNTLASEISGSIFTLTRPVMAPMLEEMGLAARGLGFTLVQGGFFDPEPVSSDKIRRRDPYTAAASWHARLEQVADIGFFTAVGDGAYQLTEDGRDALNHFLGTFRADLATVTLDTDLERLEELLGRVINACLNAPEPPGTWAISHSRNIAPDEDAPVLAKIDQYLDDLNAFRDDAHIAAFTLLNISGHAWEFFTMLWRDEVKTAAEMAEKRANRGYDTAAYTAALDDLVARGWVEITADTAVLTDKGRAIRTTAETQTDRYFYLPWLVLNQAEADELHDLMTAARDELAQLAAATAVPA